MAVQAQGGDRSPDAPFRSLCVFCGSSEGASPKYMEAATKLGRQLVQENIRLVYGGGNVGLMGQIARTVVAGGGEDAVLGVIPEELMPREVSGAMVGRVQVVKDMHERKASMAREADGFIAMPGGFGTLEELFEVITWQQLGFHRKPIALLNTDGFWDPLLDFISKTITEGFIKPQYNTLIVSPDPAELVAKMRQFQAPESMIQAALKPSQAKAVIDPHGAPQ